MGSHLRFQGETTSFPAQLKFWTSQLLGPQNHGFLHPLGLSQKIVPKNEWDEWLSASWRFFLLERIEAVSGNKESQKANTPNATSMVNTSPESMDSSSNTTPAEEKHHGEDSKHQSCVFYGLRDEKISKISPKKKNKPKIQGDKNRFRNGWIWGNSTQVSRVETQWHPWRLTSEGWNFPHHLHQRSAPFGLCRKPGHHVCVFVKPSLHRVLPHLQVMPGWGWTCPSQGGDLLGL